MRSTHVLALALLCLLGLSYLPDVSAVDPAKQPVSTRKLSKRVQAKAKAKIDSELGVSSEVSSESASASASESESESEVSVNPTFSVQSSHRQLPDPQSTVKQLLTGIAGHLSSLVDVYLPQLSQRVQARSEDIGTVQELVGTMVDKIKKMIDDMPQALSGNNEVEGKKVLAYLYQWSSGISTQVVSDLKSKDKSADQRSVSYWGADPEQRSFSVYSHLFSMADTLTKLSTMQSDLLSTAAINHFMSGREGADKFTHNDFSKNKK